jgi:hypothetical protein
MRRNLLVVGGAAAVLGAALGIALGGGGAGGASTLEAKGARAGQAAPLSGGQKGDVTLTPRTDGGFDVRVRLR